MNATRVGVVGCAGRMGRMLVAEVTATSGCLFAGGTVAPGSPFVGRDIGELAGVGPLRAKVGADTGALFDAADVVIDFSVPAASIGHAKLAAAKGKALVIGTTGFDPVQLAELADAAKKTAILRAPNMSLGVNLVLALVEQTAARLGPDYDVEIFEIHHKHKIDAPSGTALALGEAVARGRGVALGDVAVHGRQGHTGKRPAGAIGFAVARGGGEVGDHITMFCGEGERIEIAHKATSRQIYARGAVRAAMWLKTRPPGLYSMKDVLGLG